MIARRYGSRSVRTVPFIKTFGAMRFFQLYQYLFPLCLFPVSYWLWFTRYGGSHRATLLVLSIPVLFAYVLPGLGTNWLGLWEFNTRLKLGKFRPHHGFVLGTATSLMGLLCLAYPPRVFDAMEFLRAGFLMGSVLAFWNWLYDLYAIKVGFIVVNSRAFAEGRGPEAIATRYAPVFFGVFGAAYGIAVRTIEYAFISLGRTDLFWPLFIGCNFTVMALPPLAYVLFTRATSDEWGLRSYRPRA